MEAVRFQGEGIPANYKNGMHCFRNRIADQFPTFAGTPPASRLINGTQGKKVPGAEIMGGNGGIGLVIFTDMSEFLKFAVTRV